MMDPRKTQITFPQLLWGFSALVIITAIILGIGLTGGPGKQRILKRDRERVTQLERLRNGIDEFTRQKGRLPQSLTELRQTKTVHIPRRFYVDPYTGEPFDYTAFKKEYELCATFEAPTEDNEATMSNVWNHSVGYQCTRLPMASLPPGEKREPEPPQ